MPANPKLSSEVHPGTKNFLLVLYQLQILYPPKRDHPLGDPLAVPFEYLFFLYYEFFSSYRKKVLSPGGVATEMLPYGVPFESLSLLYLTLRNFFWLSIYSRYLQIFDIDGWKEGCMVDGSVLFFFFAHILKTIWYFFLIVSGSLKRWFSTYFGIFSEKKSKCYFFQKISPKSNIPFSRKVLQVFLKFFKNYSIFLPDCFCSP